MHLNPVLTAIVSTSYIVTLLSVAATSLPVDSPSTQSLYRVRSQYSQAHSLGSSYQFYPQHGWHQVNVTDLNYKYATRHSELTHTPHDGMKKRATSKTSTLGGTVTHLIDAVWNSLKGIGTSEPVIITWYTGKDLKNPSCWANPDWAPTDQSFACALTLQGWTSRPQCFKFLELCNGPKKCVFVRVVDTCAGCAAGSKHVDLTKAAFAQLADINQGLLTVQMRPATDPKNWFEDLWGPKAN